LRHGDLHRTVTHYYHGKPAARARSEAKVPGSM
jgi:hypothetical protein